MHPARSTTTMFTMALAMLAGVALPIRAGAGEIDLTRAVVVVPDGLSGPEEKAVQLLVEEVRARSGIAWDVMLRWPSGAVPVVAVGPARLLRDETSPMRKHIPPRPAAGDAREGYWLRTIDDERGRGAPTVLVAGNDARGVLFGVGRLLRDAAHEAGQGGAARSDRAGLVRRGIRSAGISSATGPRPTPTTPGTCRSGSGTSATWPSSAPTPSS